MRTTIVMGLAFLALADPASARQARPERQRPRVRVETTNPRAFSIVTGRPKFGFIPSTARDTAGAKVLAVTPDSPAERSGLKAGDVITMFNGVKLAGLENPGIALLDQARDLEVGDTVHYEFRRGSEKKQATMVAEDLGPQAFEYSFSDDSLARLEPPQVRMGFPEAFEFRGMPARWLDMELVSLNKDLGEYFGASDGVLVVQAPRDSSLHLKSGDVILAIDGRKPTSPAQVTRILRSYDRGESFEIQVLRQKKKLTLTAKVPDRERGYFGDDRDN